MYAQLIPEAAILPFMLNQLAAFGTLHFVVSKAVNWLINLGILDLTIAGCVANRQGNFGTEKAFVGTLVLAMLVTVFHGVLKLREMQARFDARSPPKPAKSPTSRSRPAASPPGEAQAQAPTCRSGIQRMSRVLRYETPSDKISALRLALRQPDREAVPGTTRRARPFIPMQQEERT